MNAAKPKPKGMGLRRPGERTTPTDEAIRALEEQAERVASKAPGGPVEATAPAATQPQPPLPRQEDESTPPATTRKVQVSAYLPADVRDELRRAAVALAGPPHMETVTSIIERAVVAELERLRDAHGPFPETSMRPRPGRRAG